MYLQVGGADLKVNDAPIVKIVFAPKVACFAKMVASAAHHTFGFPNIDAEVCYAVTGI